MRSSYTASGSVRWRSTRRYGGVLALVAIATAALVAGDRLGFFGSAPAKPTPDWDKYHDKTLLVTRVIDGDTIHLDMPDDGKVYTVVRLWGVDPSFTPLRASAGTI